jgi:hypothetical protein
MEASLMRLHAVLPFINPGVNGWARETTNYYVSI